MLGLGFGEILLIAVVLLVVVGPDRLPKFMRTAGRLYGQMRRAADEMRRSLVLEADRQDAEDRYQRLQERRKKAEEARKKAMEESGGSVAQGPTIAPPTPTAPDDPEAGRVEPDHLPPGVTQAEWDALPEHIRNLLMSEHRAGGARSDGAA